VIQVDVTRNMPLEAWWWGRGGSALRGGGR